MTAVLLPWDLVERRPSIGPVGRPLVLFGLAILAIVPVSLAGLWLDPRTLDAGHIGAESVWLKPLKFQLSVGVHLVTVGLCMAGLSEARRADRLMRILVVTLLGCSAFEIAYITSRGALGLRSHFATDVVGLVGFHLMGLGAVAIVVATAIIGVRVLRGRPVGMSRHLCLAIGLGLVISGVTGLVSGATIGELDGPLVGAADGTALPLFGWSTVGGDLRISHFAGLHAAQALPLLALAVGPRGPLEGRVVVWIGAGFLVALALFTYVQALAGRPFLPL